MKFKYTAGALAILFLVSAPASAQLIAGSPEDDLFGLIEAATSDSERLELAMQFESEFPGSPADLQILTMIMNIYNQRQDSANAVEYAEKMLEIDEDNAEALIAMTYNLALTREDIPRRSSTDSGRWPLSRRCGPAKRPQDIHRKPGPSIWIPWQRRLKAT